MAKCHICGPHTGNEAAFSVGIGPLDLEMLVCRYCRDDLPKFGVKVNQVVALPRIVFVVRVLGPVSKMQLEVCA